MTLVQLRYLLAIVDADLNITAAAERVNASQPGVSKQVKLLEEELGFQIFVRRGKSLECLTAAGEEVARRARLVVAEAANIRTLAANQRGETEGELVIATTQTQARFALPPALQLLKARYPNVTVRINFLSGVESLRAATQDADVLIASHTHRPQSPDPVIPLYSWRRMALFPVDHPLEHLGRPLSPADVAKYPLVGYESALGTHAAVAAAFAEHALTPRFAYAAHDTEVIKTYVRRGLGVGLSAEMALGDDADLAHAPITGLPTCTTYAQLKVGRVVRDYVTDFVSALAPQATLRAIRRGATDLAGVAPLEWSAWRDTVDVRARVEEAARAARVAA
jgi:LysR family transcriptional regulator, cys regulon transcriptional activator